MYYREAPSLKKCKFQQNSVHLSAFLEAKTTQKKNSLCLLKAIVKTLHVSGGSFPGISSYSLSS